LTMELPKNIEENVFQVEKPWGNFRQFCLNQQATVKILTVNPQGVLSLQDHEKRDELWHFLDDNAKVILGDKTIEPRAGSELFIPKRTKHRLIAKDSTTKVLEVSFGHFDENDIRRYDDQYGRIRNKEGQDKAGRIQ